MSWGMMKAARTSARTMARSASSTVAKRSSKRTTCVASTICVSAWLRLVLLWSTTAAGIWRTSVLMA
jgi:hypothetical protein